MDNADLEGLEGIQLHNGTFSNDIIIVVVLILLSVFAWAFRQNIPLFGKLLSNIYAGEQRQSIFETIEKDSFLFNTFMTFQTLLLISIFMFSIAVKFSFIVLLDYSTTLLSFGGFFVLIVLFYHFKKGLYALFGAVFIETSANKMMFKNYQALFCLWGVALYLPVICVLLFDTHLLLIITLLISYLAFRAILAFRFINIFYNKNTGFLFLSLYLCAQEIVPLVFLYEGMVYIKSVIEIKNTWQ